MHLADLVISSDLRYTEHCHPENLHSTFVFLIFLLLSGPGSLSDYVLKHCLDLRKDTERQSFPWG